MEYIPVFYVYEITMDMYATEVLISRRKTRFTIEQAIKSTEQERSNEDQQVIIFRKQNSH